MPSIRKAIQDISEGDLLALLGQSEDDQIEFKGCVPHEQQADEWAQKKDLTKFGVNKLLRSVVAFANSYGGDLIVGIDEGAGELGKAEKLTPVPHCMELAQRLSQRAHDLIDPPIPSLQVRGIPLSDDGAGIVVLRVGRSRLAPHRHEGLKEVFQRVRHEIRRMSMRQVQDLTFSASRGLAAVEQRLEQARQEFRKWAKMDQQVPTHQRLCFRVTALPANADCYLTKVHNVEEVRPSQRVVEIKLSPSDKPDELHTTIDVYNWRPVLRGSVAEDGGDEGARVSVYCDGLISYELSRTREPSPGQVGLVDKHILYYGWLFGCVVNAIECADRFRQRAGASGAEYALEIEVATTHKLPVIRTSGFGYSTIGYLSPGFHQFPQYAIGDKSTWNEVMTLIRADLWNALGSAAPDEQVQIVSK